MDAILFGWRPICWQVLFEEDPSTGRLHLAKNLAESLRPSLWSAWVSRSATCSSTELTAWMDWSHLSSRKLASQDSTSQPRSCILLPLWFLEQDTREFRRMYLSGHPCLPGQALRAQNLLALCVLKSRAGRSLASDLDRWCHARGGAPMPGQSQPHKISPGPH